MIFSKTDKNSSTPALKEQFLFFWQNSLPMWEVANSVISNLIAKDTKASPRLNHFYKILQQRVEASIEDNNQTDKICLSIFQAAQDFYQETLKNLTIIEEKSEKLDELPERVEALENAVSEAFQKARDLIDDCWLEVDGESAVEEFIDWGKIFIKKAGLDSEGVDLFRSFFEKTFELAFNALNYEISYFCSSDDQEYQPEEEELNIIEQANLEEFAKSIVDVISNLYDMTSEINYAFNFWEEPTRQKNLSSNADEARGIFLILIAMYDGISYCYNFALSAAFSRALFLYLEKINDFFVNSVNELFKNLQEEINELLSSTHFENEIYPFTALTSTFSDGDDYIFSLETEETYIHLPRQNGYVLEYNDLFKTGKLIPISTFLGEHLEKTRELLKDDALSSLERTITEFGENSFEAFSKREDQFRAAFDQTLQNNRLEKESITQNIELISLHLKGLKNALAKSSELISHLQTGR